MSERYDYVAVGPHGVYAMCSDVPKCSETRRFIATALRKGHHVERVPVQEAVRRHVEFLRLSDPAAVVADLREGSGS